ncbi:acyl carrier protein [Streptomyces griseus]|uniref:acyl carrier protein n=1 Tax=Streptomyces griseus TaxID=1911 RepID=UPI00083FEEFF|nr:acyl carrier protein [Streptomyces griseus]
MNRAEALEVVEESLASTVPDADLTGLGPDDLFREALDMDSLDFLSFVETLGDRAGIRIDDEDSPELTTLSASADFLAARTGTPAE